MIDKWWWIILVVEMVLLSWDWIVWSWSGVIDFVCDGLC